MTSRTCHTIWDA